MHGKRNCKKCRGLIGNGDQKGRISDDEDFIDEDERNISTFYKAY